jgi:hypothetical protein
MCGGSGPCAQISRLKEGSALDRASRFSTAEDVKRPLGTDRPSAGAGALRSRNN